MIGRTNAVAAASFGHTIDFISDNAPYAKYIVTDGQSVAAPSPDPTKSGQHFGGWQDDGTAVTFPYTPTGDVTLAAEFVTTRDGMVLSEANKLICTLSNRNYRKINGGWCIAGYIYNTGTSPAMSHAMLVGLTEASVVWGVPNYNAGVGGSITYNGQLYYYSNNINPQGTIGEGGDWTSSATDVTDLHKTTASTYAAAAEWLIKKYLYEI